MIILGIDPGTIVSGFGILKSFNNRTILIESGFLKLSSIKPLSERVFLFNNFFEDKITKFEITDISLETPFLGRNAQNFLKLGYLRGIIYCLSHKHKINIHEYSPREVKQAVTGFGGASKEQVSRAMIQFFPGIKCPKKLDITDALAVSLCGLWKSKKVV